MALAYLNRCGFVPTSGGTGTWTVSTAITGFVTPANATNPSVVDGDIYQYFAQNDAMTEWEVGYGAYTVSGTTLARTIILSSSNAGGTVNFTNPPNVYAGAPLAQNIGYELLQAGEGSGDDTPILLLLPARYTLFKLDLYLQPDSFEFESNWLAYQFSNDGGSTWSFVYSGVAMFGEQFGSGTAETKDLPNFDTDQFGLVNFTKCSSGTIQAQLYIQPGGSFGGIDAPSVNCTSTYIETGNQYVETNMVTEESGSIGRADAMQIFCITGGTGGWSNIDMEAGGWYRFFGVR